MIGGCGSCWASAATLYDRCAHHAQLALALQDSQFLVGPMTTEQLRAAITRPAALSGTAVESGLLAALVADCAGQAAVLPLLSHALRETWARRRGMTMTLAGYQAAGGIAHAIAQTAETTYAECGKQQQLRMKALLLRLTVLGDGTADTKRRITRAELDGEDRDTQAVLDRLTRARLVTVDGEHIEIAHEALIRYWSRLRGWLAEDREGVRIHHQLTACGSTVGIAGSRPGPAYRGTRPGGNSTLGHRRACADLPRARVPGREPGSPGPGAGRDPAADLAHEDAGGTVERADGDRGRACDRGPR